jgi:hypothetical protein
MSLVGITGIPLGAPGVSGQRNSSNAVPKKSTTQMPRDLAEQNDAGFAWKPFFIKQLQPIPE